MIEKYLGIPIDYVIIGMAALLLILLILTIVLLAKTAKLKKRLSKFMTGKHAKSLEDTLVRILNQVDEIQEANDQNRRAIDLINKKMQSTFQKYALLKYDAFEESGGKMSTILVMLDEKNNGYILNIVHGREGSYTYTKEIIGGNSIVQLGEEEMQALDEALSK